MTSLTLKSLRNGLITTVFTMTTSENIALAHTLREYYELALKASETVRATELDVRISESDRARIDTQLKPRVTLGADGRYHVNKYDRENWGNNKTLGVRTEFRQPLLDGGSTAAALSVLDANIEAFQWDVKSEEQTLFLRVAALFYESILQQQDIQNLEETEKVLERRINDLTAWERIGRSRQAEVFSARTQLELTKGMIAQSRINKNAAEEELAWLTNLDLPLKIEDDLSLEKITPKDRTVSREKSADGDPSYKLPSVAAAEARVRAAEKSIELTRTDLKPTLDFIAEHQWSYLDPTDQGFHDFSFGVGLTWLLYDAGQVNARVTTANLVKAQAEVVRQRAEREGRLSLGLVNRRLEDSLRQINSYQSALRVVERTLGVQREEANSGLITNFEVLSTLDQRLQIRRNLDLALNRAKLIYIQSEVFSGNWLRKEGNPSKE